MNCRQSYHIYIIAVDWVADSFRAEWNIYGGPNEAAMAWQVPISGDILSLWALVKQLWPNFLWLWMCANHREMWTDYRLRKSAKTENHCKPEPYQYFTRLRLNVLLLQKQKVVFWNHNSEIKKKKSSQHSSMPRVEGRPPNPLFVCIWVTCHGNVCADSQYLWTKELLLWENV